MAVPDLPNQLTQFVQRNSGEQLDVQIGDNHVGTTNAFEALRVRRYTHPGQILTFLPGTIF